MIEVKTLTLEPAAARGALPGNALRGLLDLASSGEPQQRTWLANAVASVLGQLVVTPTSTSHNVLAGACGVATAKRGLRGIEAVLVSAVLGADPNVVEQATAEELWSRYFVPSTEVTPVVNPRTRELAFLSSADLEQAASHTDGLRAGLLDALDRADDSGRAPTSSDAQLSFVLSVLLAAGAVGAASGDLSPAGAGASAALPDRLASGDALLVEVLLTKAHVEITADDDGAVLCPRFASLNPSEVAAGAAPQHAFWKVSWRCSTTVPAVDWLPMLVVSRGRSFVLGALPEADPDTSDASAPRRGKPARGYLPAAVAKRGSRGTGPDRLTVRRQPEVPSSTPFYVSYAPLLDPKTGLPSYYPVYPPGYEPPGGSPPAGVPIQPPPGEMTRRVLTDSLRTLDLSPETTVGEVVRAINDSTYGAALNRATYTLRGLA